MKSDCNRSRWICVFSKCIFRNIILCVFDSGNQKRKFHFLPSLGRNLMFPHFCGFVGKGFIIFFNLLLILQTDKQTNKQTYGHFDLWKESAQRADSLKMQVPCSNGLGVMMSCDTWHVRCNKNGITSFINTFFVLLCEKNAFHSILDLGNYSSNFFF